MTIDQLKAFAEEDGIDVSGLSTKQEYADRVAASASSADALKDERARLDAEAETPPADDADADATPGATPSVADEGDSEEAAPIDEDEHRLDADDMSLRPESEREGSVQAAQPEAVGRISPAD